jgi:transposase
MSVLTHLLPDSKNLKLESWLVDEIKTKIWLIVSAITRVVNCPVCNQPTHRIHSRYERKLTDLPWADYSITLQLRVRKFFCINTLCKRRIFTERLTSVTAPWARRTLRLAQRLSAIGLALGGAAGVRLSEQLGVTASRNTLLKLVRSIPLPPIVTPQILGVDDFCFRKCKTYGTALIDLERSRPIALLKDAKAIARQVGIGVTSVFNHLRTPTFPEPQRRKSLGRSILVPYHEYILQRWNQGCHEGLLLFEEIQKQGYKGSYDTVARYTRRIRTVQGIQPRKRYSVKSLPKVTQPKKLCTSNFFLTSEF